MSDKFKNKQAGKGMTPIQGYNPKNWYANYDAIFRKRAKNKSGNVTNQCSKSNK
jgi:hypothetical protein